MARPIFTPMYEETETDIKSRMLGRISDDWRKEPGDFIYDAVVTAPLEIKQLEANQDFILQNAFAIYAKDEYLDLKLSEIGLDRNPATANKRALSITAAAGVIIPASYPFSVILLDPSGNPLIYTTDQATTFVSTETKIINVTCTTPGTIGNIPTSSFIMQPPILGVTSIVDSGTVEAGAEAEDDDSAYNRYIDKLRYPDTGGNKNDYVRWATSIEGVGKAKCIPRWNGNGTVKVVLVGTDYKPAAAEIVTAAQDYLDPGKTGLGDGKAPCGALVDVVAATALMIDIAATITLYNGVLKDDVVAAFTSVIDTYLADMAFSGSPVVAAKVGSLLIGTYGVSNYTGLTINGGTADIVIADDAVAVRGTITL